jgi:hypothetical protein
MHDVIFEFLQEEHLLPEQEKVSKWMHKGSNARSIE